MGRRWLGRQAGGVVVGLGLTVGAVGVHLAGFTERIELLGFDFHVRSFSNIPASDRIVHIDINDDALDRVGSWPWPRDLQAELVRILHEMGAGQIVMDIVFSEPKPGEVRLPVLDRYADIEGEMELLGEVSPENVVFPDDELALAVAEAGNVHLALYYEEPSAAGEPGRGGAGGLASRIAQLLRQDFELDPGGVARRLGEDVRAVEAVLAGAKRRVAEERVAAILEANPTAGVEEVHSAILSTPFDRQTADRADVVAAYHRQLGLRSLRSKCPPVPPGLAGRIPRVARVIPPVYKLTTGARSAGFVTFTPDVDGNTRRVPLLIEWDGRLIEQLAVRAAREVLDIRLEDLKINGAGDLVIAGRGDRPERRVQLDEQGEVLINWHVPSPRWVDCFTHLPVAQLLRIYDCRRQIKENEIRRQVATARAMQLVKEEAGYEAYRRQVNALLALERQVRWATLQGRADAEEVKAAAAEARRLRRVVEEDQKQTLAYLGEMWADLKAQPDPHAPDVAADYKRFQQANALVEDKVAHLERANARISVEQQRWLDQLMPMIAGKTCFVGYTAAAVADMVTTPPFGRAPGVLVHSNLFNSLLAGRTRTWSMRAVQASAIALLGVLVTAMSVSRGPWASLAFVLVAIAMSFALNALAVFERMDHWLRLVFALVVTFVVWAMIVLFRLLVTDRQKRRFSRAVAQYVSPAMARRIADEAASLDLSPVNGVATCFFSDLAGFTPISERLGPEGTRLVLNPYLEAMSGVLHRHGALINKFMGDGVFAFFNAPILACERHEAAACEAALDSQQALREMAARHAGHPLAGEFGRLHMRIGLASGPVFVGDYGSESKLDYTCVGDTVNLAARLESANKQFGTRLMVAEATRSAAGARYEYRRLGRLKVVGQSVAVPAYELIGRAGEVDGQVRHFAELFGQAVEAFAGRDWTQAAALLDRCLELRPNDPGALRYLGAIRTLRDAPPPDDWSGALELTEK